MKFYLYITSLVGIALIAGYSFMWGNFDDYRKEIEEAPHTHEFARLQWSIDALKEKNQESGLDHLIDDLSQQIDAQNSFFSDLREERLDEDNDLLITSRILFFVFLAIAAYTNPKQKTQPADGGNG